MLCVPRERFSPHPPPLLKKKKPVGVTLKPALEEYAIVYREQFCPCLWLDSVGQNRAPVFFFFFLCRILPSGISQRESRCRVREERRRQQVRRKDAVRGWWWRGDHPNKNKGAKGKEGMLPPYLYLAAITSRVPRLLQKAMIIAITFFCPYPPFLKGLLYNILSIWYGINQVAIFFSLWPSLRPSHEMSAYSFAWIPQNTPWVSSQCHCYILNVFKKICSYVSFELLVILHLLFCSYDVLFGRWGGGGESSFKLWVALS